jgi:hypothetical protein
MIQLNEIIGLEAHVKPSPRASPSADRAPTRRKSSAASSSYLSASETRALLANSFANRQQRLQAEDMISTDEAAELANTSRVTINAWIAKGRAIGLTQIKRGFRMPRWQFEPRIWEALPHLSAALGTKEGWALLAFLESPHGGLGGRTPRQAIEQGEAARVIELAAREGN